MLATEARRHRDELKRRLIKLSILCASVPLWLIFMLALSVQLCHSLCCNQINNLGE